MKCEKLDVWKNSARLSANVYKAFKDQARFLDIAKGSAAEFATQTYIGMDIGYIDNKEGKSWVEESDHILSMLSNLQKSIREKS